MMVMRWWSSFSFIFLTLSVQTQILEAMGATVERVRPVSITHNDHFVNVARRRALEARAAKSESESVLHTLAEPDQELEKLLDEQVKNSGSNPDEESPTSSEEFTNSVEKEIMGILVAGVTKDSERKDIGVNEDVDAEAQSRKSFTENGTSDLSDQGGGGYFADQFENLANFRAHYEGTGPEIWEQSGGNLDAFVAAAGTGGTIAGISRYIKVILYITTLQLFNMIELFEYKYEFSFVKRGTYAKE